jgi:hypothetical protein
MVNDLVSKFVESLARGDVHPHLQQDAMSSHQMIDVAKKDINTGILSMKDFNKEFKPETILGDFTKVYRNVLTSVRVSTNDVLDTITDVAKEIPFYRPVMTMREKAVTNTLTIIQATETANQETNNSYYNLRVVLSDIKAELRLFGAGHSVGITSELEKVAQIADRLESTKSGRDSLKDLFKIQVPKEKYLGGYTTRSMMLPQRAVVAALPDYKNNYLRYAINWIMIIDSYLAACDAAKEFYEMGGNISEFISRLSGEESLPVFERKLKAAFDTIQNTLSDHFNEMSSRAMSKDADFPEERDAWKTASNNIRKISIESKSRGEDKRRTFEQFHGAAMVLKTRAIEAFEVKLPDHAHFK